ncbi:hypothetical protein KCMC57_64470 (plasmid) [Kitasatospora sp. CMC57]|uniref:Uncharacterized protein n=1 Tax=Kitasatospora sp. CMC57 TaxID=3231513 RepID=A0AB33K9D0_9ACTN
MTTNPLEPTVQNPDLPCPHQDFEASVEVNRLTANDNDPTVIGYSADIKVRCANCQEQFRWTGLQAGLSQAHPMCSIDESVLCAPLRPASADPDFGIGLPGYAINYRESPTPADTPPGDPQ